MNAARLFLAGKLREDLRLPTGFAHGQFRPWLFTPLGFSPTPDGRQLVPFYPPGLSALQAVLALPTGSVEDGARAANVLCGVLLVFLCYRLGRALGLSRTASWAATAMVAVNPVTLRFFTWNMSDGPATTWAVAAFFFAVRAGKKPAYALLAGFFFALGFATRPTNALLAPALAFALWGNPRTLLAFALGAAPILGPLLGYNHAQYGAFWRTGYGAVAREFKLRYALPTLGHYGVWFARFFSPLGLLPLLAHGRALCHRHRTHLLLALWWLPFFGFYAFYKYTNDAWWYLRFVLPAFPALVLGSVAAFPEIEEAVRNRWKSRWTRVLPAVFLAAAFAASLFWLAKLRVLHLTRDEAIYREAVHWVCRQTPENSVVFASQLSGALYFYSSRAIVRPDLATPAELAQILRAAEAQGSPVFMALFDDEARVFTRRYPGLAEPRGNLGRVSLFSLATGPRRPADKAAPAAPPRRPSVIPDPPRP